MKTGAETMRDIQRERLSIEKLVNFNLHRIIKIEFDSKTKMEKRHLG